MDHYSELKEERKKVKELMNKQYVENDIWLILKANWFNKWEEYVRYDNENEDDISDVGVSPPGSIDNDELLSSGKLLPNLAVGADLYLVPKEVWDMFSQRYGCNSKTAEFERTVMKSLSNELSLDLYPPELQFCDRTHKRERFTQAFCLSDTIGDVKKVLQDKYKLSPTENILLYADRYCEDIISKDNALTLKELSLDGKRKLYYEVLERNDKLDTGYHQPKSFPRVNNLQFPPGVCGLRNLGNTCFMNSAIQCISNVPKLTKYFLNPDFTNDLNTKNRLGSGGKVAREFGYLIQRMWNPSEAGGCCIPRELKSYIGKFASQFAGYQQHDAQELMSFLLDFLSEDLNRVEEKPYIEAVDSNGRPDEEVAKEAWDNYKKRSDSIIVDLFYGLLKSTLKCPTCKFVSVIFDPFALLSLSVDNIQPLVTLWSQHHESKDETEWKPILHKPYMHPCYKCVDVIEYFKKMSPPQKGYQYVVAELKDHGLQVIRCEDKRHLKNAVLAVFELQEGSFVQVEIRNSRGLGPFLVSCSKKNRVLKPGEMRAVVRQNLANYFGSKLGEAILGDAQIDCDGEINLDSDCPQVTFSREQFTNYEDLFGKAPQRKLRLTDCLDFFTYTETLGEHDAWYCSKCKEHKRASKTFGLWRLPSVLVFHLKRYRNRFAIQKNNVFVDCPVENLEIVDCRDRKGVYDLAAVSNHMGGMGGGHYTATAKNNGKWYYFDDSSVGLASGNVVTENAYILIYIRKEDGDQTVQSNGDTNLFNHCNSIQDSGWPLSPDQ